MRTALTDLGLERLVVLYPGATPYALGDRVSVVPPAVLADGTMDTLFPPPVPRSKRKSAAIGRDAP